MPSGYAYESGKCPFGVGLRVGRRWRGTLRYIDEHVDDDAYLNPICAAIAPALSEFVSLVFTWCTYPTEVWLRVDGPDKLVDDETGTEYDTSGWTNYRAQGTSDTIHEASWRFAVRYSPPVGDPYVLFSAPADYGLHDRDDPFGGLEGYDADPGAGLVWEVDIASCALCTGVIEITETDNSESQTHPLDCAADGMRTTTAATTFYADGRWAILVNGALLVVDDAITEGTEVKSDAAGYDLQLMPITSVGVLNLDAPASIVARSNDPNLDAMTGGNVLELELGAMGAMPFPAEEIDESYSVTLSGTITGTYGVECVSSEWRLSGNRPPYSDSGPAYLLLDLDYTKLPARVRYVGETTYFDGTSPAIDPEYKDPVGNTWAGDDSGVIEYPGTWGAAAKWVVTGGSTTTLDTWLGEDEAPASWRVEFMNPADYGLETDDRRAQILYTSEYDALGSERESAEVTIEDSFTLCDLTDSDEYAEWVGVGCSVSGSGSGLAISNVTAGAYIYRDYPDKPGVVGIDDGLYDRRHWPIYRFVSLDIDGANPDRLRLGVGKDDALEDEKEFYAQYEAARWTEEANFDVCAAITALPKTDRTQTYFEMKPGFLWIPERQFYDGEDEAADTSWSWGPGRLRRLKVSGFTVGQSYTLRSVDCWYDKADVYITRGYDDWHELCEYLVPGEEPHYNQIYAHRMCMALVDGRVGFECMSVTKHVTPLMTYWNNATVKTCFDATWEWDAYDEEYDILAPNRFPYDEFGAISATGYDYDSAWEHTPTSAEPWDWDNDNVLYCWDLCPMWFLSAIDKAGEVWSVKTRPRFDHLSMGAYYQMDEAGECINIPYVMQLRGRTFGITEPRLLTPAEGQALDGTEPATEDITITDSATDVTSPEDITTDGLGYWRSKQHVAGATVGWERAGRERTAAIDSRCWYRIVFAAGFEAAAGGRRMRHGKAWADLPEGVSYRDVELLTN